ncbi:MAG TPA: HDOD domain-containing protein [Candidatus Acidoferrales bacterium]
MPAAIDDQTRTSANRGRANPRIHSLANTVATSDPRKSDALDRLRNLLISAPIDLSGISDEIRRHPDLESLVLRLGVSLALSPDEPLNTVEEAVVVLGTSRVRVLIDLWSSAPRSTSADASNSQLPSHASLSPTEAPEVGYLSNFLRCLESDSPGHGERLAAWASKIPTDETHTLTDLFMRDFFSLLPLIQPNVRDFAAPSQK